LKLCYKCGAAWVSEHRFPGRAETCERCGYDLRCCLNCRFYDSPSPNQCKSPTTELVLDKEKGNFCDEFEFAEDKGPEKQDGTRETSRDKWKDLFGGD